MTLSFNQLAPCGVFCGACPSYNKSCLGCSSESKDQKRTSKWNCPIRKCCFEQRGHQYCADCSDFPCEKINKKLIHSHPNDPKFTYRHEIPENVNQFNALGQEAYLLIQMKKWSCPECGGRILFYVYRCQDCGMQLMD